ncbi:hypothetical protein CABS01_01766 [Colletotrichum abscissum]|uniref:uncharacterized protein n=1 Tax=Colletotrichum abscissum TaxID=1671311 RepID=UPI0027D60BF8|nr:uncharacterized protein CABS01_01766 [Colletotrichum abscissum]KAK1495959.1 hypothetical protein CABS01_01766 [Colletotrichum abscissum]
MPLVLGPFYSSFCLLFKVFIVLSYSLRLLSLVSVGGNSPLRMRIAAAHLLLLSPLFWNCTGSAVFHTPPAPGPQYDFQDNPQYALGEIIDIQWSTDDQFVDLFVVQTSPDLETLAAVIMDENVPSTIKWRVSFDGFPLVVGIVVGLADRRTFLFNITIIDWIPDGNAERNEHARS